MSDPDRPGTGAGAGSSNANAGMDAMTSALTAYAGVPSNTLSTTVDASDVDFNDVFSLRRPQNVMSGLSSGLQSTAKGVLAGTAALFAAPYVGAQQGGASGFAKGLAAGVASAVVLPVVGATVGMTQIVRGAMNTPEAIHEANAGKRWNSYTREWVQDDLVKESVTLSETTDDEVIEKARKRAKANGRQAGVQDFLNNGGGDESSGDGSSSSNKKVASTEFYDVLGVEPTADESTIKRAYYLLARKLHPDKNRDDPNAGSKFQKIGEAYQVLSDTELRKKYDSKGKDGLGEHVFVDTSHFFDALFGSDQMEGLVGRLQLATMAVAGAELTKDEHRLLQERRVGRLAIKLAAILDGFDEKDPSEFEGRSEAMTKTLASASYGVAMLRLIGFVYEKQAFEFINDPVGGLGTWADLGLRSTISRFEQMRGRLNSQVNAASSGWKAFQAFRQGEAEAQKVADGSNAESKDSSQDSSSAQKESDESKSNAARAKYTQDAMPHVLEALWNASALDIERTIRAVCFKVLHDFSVGKERRALRAEALTLLGAIFQKATQPEGSKNNAMANLEEAMRKAFTNKEEGSGGESEGEMER